MFKIIVSPARTRHGQWYNFCRQETSLLKTFTGRFVKFIELQQCVKAKCVSETETSNLAATLLTGKFWVTPSAVQALRRVTFIFSAISSIISSASTVTIRSLEDGSEISVIGLGGKFLLRRHPVIRHDIYKKTWQLCLKIELSNFKVSILHAKFCMISCNRISDRTIARIWSKTE